MNWLYMNENIKILDFDLYINKNWIDKTAIPDDKSEYSTFSIIGESNKEKLKQLILELESKYENNIIGLLHSKLYHKKFIDSEKSFCELRKYILQFTEISEYFRNNFNQNNFYCELLFSVDVRKTPFSNYNMLVLSPSILGLPDKIYYHLDKYSDIKKKYFQFIRNIFLFVDPNYSADDLDNIAENVLKIEDCLSFLRKGNDEMRDVSKIYKKLSKDEFISLITDNCENSDSRERILSIYDKLFSLINIDELIIMDTNYFHKLSIIICEFDDNVFHDYFRYVIIRNYYHCIYQLEDLFFDFYSREIDNKESKGDYDDRIINFLESIAGELLSEEYVKKYFDKEKKERIEKLVITIRNEFRFSIKNSDWMDDFTKNNSLKKIDNMKFKIGRPDEYPNHDHLKNIITSFLNGDITLFNMIKTINDNDFHKKIETLNKTNTEWHMLYHHVNAYYTPTKNEVVIPAGILEYPIFKNDDSIESVISNYAMIGMVIAHEISHGFDDQGRKYDFEGNFGEMYSIESEKKYNQKIQQLKNQINNIKIEINGKKYDVNLDLTMGEIIADLNGLSITYKSLIRNYKLTGQYQKIFFQSYAELWKRKIRDQYLIKKLIIDPHPPCKVRIDMIRNIDKFYDIYDVHKDYYLDPKDRIKIF